MGFASARLSEVKNLNKENLNLNLNLLQRGFQAFHLAFELVNFSGLPLLKAADLRLALFLLLLQLLCTLLLDTFQLIVVLLVLRVRHLLTTNSNRFDLLLASCIFRLQSVVQLRSLLFDELFGLLQLFILLIARSFLLSHCA